MLPSVTAELRAVTDADLRFSPGGVAVASFRAAANSRKKDEATGEWKDDKVCWLTVKCFKKLAENVAESVTKGQLVNVTGRLQTEDWETEAGEKRQTYVLMADTVGVSIAFAPAQQMASVQREAPATIPDDGGVRATQTDTVAAPAAPQTEEPPF